MLGRNVDAYVDEMVVKSRKVEDHVANLEEFFATVNHFDLKLNLKKCSAIS